MLEAVPSGCILVVPDRLAYKEFFEAEFRYPSSPDDPEREAEALAKRLVSLATLHGKGSTTAPDVSRLSWCRLRPAYEAAFNTVQNRFQRPVWQTRIHAVTDLTSDTGSRRNELGLNSTTLHRL